MSTTKTTEQLAAAVEAAVEDVRRTLDDDGLVRLARTGTWVEAAAATHGGHCPSCGESCRTEPGWDWVDEQPWGWEIRGVRGEQCGGCGQHGQGWVHTGARDLAGRRDAEAAIRALIDDAAARRDAVAAEIDAKTEADLRRRLAAWVDSAVELLDGGDINEAWDAAGLARSDTAWEPSPMRDGIDVGEVSGWAPPCIDDGCGGIWVTVHDDRITQALIDALDEQDS